LRAVPAHFKGSAAETFVISHYYFGAIWIFEGDIGQAAEGVSPDMIRSWSNELTELPNQVVIVRVGHVTRMWIDGHNEEEPDRLPARSCQPALLSNGYSDVEYTRSHQMIGGSLGAAPNGNERSRL